jgi:FkbM family methyltransferase
MGGRTFGFLLKQVVEPANYRAMWNVRTTAVHPADFAARYLFGRGSYPARCQVRTPAGVIAPYVYTHHDVITMNEVFCREDYRLPARARVVVDIGSNIGISALYFLTRSPEVRCHLYEPDPRNVERLRRNLAAYAGRFVLTEAAVADRSGLACFGREPSGRYGGLESGLGDQIEVDCLHIDEVLAAVLEREDAIDMLKIDTEGLENRTVEAITPDLLARVRVVCFETQSPVNPAPERFALDHAADTARLTNRAPVDLPSLRTAVAGELPAHERDEGTADSGPGVARRSLRVE